MMRDQTRRDGFYWVRFEGQSIVAEYSGKGPGGPGWSVPGSSTRYQDAEVCEMMSARLIAPKMRQLTTPADAEAAGKREYLRVTGQLGEDGK